MIHGRLVSTKRQCAFWNCQPLEGFVRVHFRMSRTIRSFPFWILQPSRSSCGSTFGCLAQFARLHFGFDNPHAVCEGPFYDVSRDSLVCISGLPITFSSTAMFDRVQLRVSLVVSPARPKRVGASSPASSPPLPGPGLWNLNLGHAPFLLNLFSKIDGSWKRQLGGRGC